MAEARDVSRRWSSNIRCLLFANYLNATMTATVQGAIFDAYLKALPGGSNTFVGSVESARGIAALVLAVPLGWAADLWPKCLVLRCAVVVGGVSCLLLAFAIPLGSVPLLYAGSVISGVHGQALMGTLPAMLAELTTPGTERTRAMADMQTARSLGMASGPAMQLVLTLALGAQEWTAGELRWIICAGLLLYVPYVAIVLRFRAEPASAPASITAGNGTSSAGAGELLREPGGQTVEGDGAKADASELRPAALVRFHLSEAAVATTELTQRRKWTIAILLEAFAIVSTLGSGMTFKFWPLFFIADFGFSPAAVCLMQCLIWLSIAVGSQGMACVTTEVGRIPACILTLYCGAFLLLLISLGASLVPTVAMTLVRNALMNANTPIIQAVVLDMVPQHHRGKWSAIASLKRSSWSGSAFIGGMLSDHHDYKYAFFITAIVHFLAGSFLFPAAVLHR